jgi:large subunit ribosomal protein L9
MPIQLLLLDDVDELGRSGDVVNVKPGYARNFLIPQKIAVPADKHTLRMQAKLQEERAKKAEIDKRESEELAMKYSDLELQTIAKVDPEGHMYGSVSAIDIVKLFEEKGIKLEKKNIILAHPIKTLGKHQLKAKLKEGVIMPFSLMVESDIPLPQKPKEIEIVEEVEIKIEESEK